MINPTLASFHPAIQLTFMGIDGKQAIDQTFYLKIATSIIHRQSVPGLAKATMNPNSCIAQQRLTCDLSLRLLLPRPLLLENLQGSFARPSGRSA